MLSDPLSFYVCLILESKNLNPKVFSKGLTIKAWLQHLWILVFTSSESEMDWLLLLPRQSCFIGLKASIGGTFVKFVHRRSLLGLVDNLCERGGSSLGCLNDLWYGKFLNLHLRLLWFRNLLPPYCLL